MRFLKSVFCGMALAVLPAALPAAADPAQEVSELREMIRELKSDYESRIEALEKRLQEAEAAVAEARERADKAGETAGEAEELAEEVAMRPQQRTSRPSDLNPQVGVVLVGSYNSLDVGGEDYAVPGFILGPETGPGQPGFSLGESEFNLDANVDDKLYGDVTFALADHEGGIEVELEEAYLQTLTLPMGFTLTGGRFFSDIGYQNSFHLHADDFTDRPLPYQAFLANQFKDDGVQLTWLAPTPFFLELGTELLQGDSFPGASEPSRDVGTWTLFGHVGGDVGSSHSWRAGLSYLNADVKERGVAEEEHGEEHATFFKQEEPHGELFFSGDSELWVADFVYKWAPEGNPRNRNLKLAAEYFRREEDGTFGGEPFDGEQSGWYVQGLYQFHPQWRGGYRYDRLDADNDGAAVAGSPLDPLGLNPERHSLVLEWFNSEFSRVRLQYTRDESTPVPDDQLFLQYIISIGAHRAHEF